MFVIDFSSHLTKKRFPVRNVRISLDSGTLAASIGAAGAAHEVVWWSLVENRLIARTLLYSPGYDISAEPVFVPDLSRAVVHGFTSGHSTDMSYPVLISPSEDIAQGLRLSFSDSDVTTLESLAITPDARWVLAAHSGWAQGASVSRWDLREAAQLLGFGILSHEGREINVSEQLFAIAVSPNGRWLACGLGASKVALLDFDSGEEVASLEVAGVIGGNLPVHGLTYSSGGKWLAARAGEVVTICDVNRESMAAQLKPTKLTDAAFTPDGKRMLTGGSDNMVRVCDTATWKEIARYDWKIGPIHSVTVSPDGLTAAAGGTQSRVVVWDVES